MNTELRKQFIQAGISEDNLDNEWFATIILLLAIPRSFNLVLMQRLVEEFEPRFKPEKILSYITWPHALTTLHKEIINWNIAKGGYTISQSIRQSLITYIEKHQSQKYMDVNQYLITFHFDCAIIVGLTVTDQARHFREYLYSSLICKKDLTPDEVFKLFVARSNNITTLIKTLREDEELKDNSIVKEVIQKLEEI